MPIHHQPGAVAQPRRITTQFDPKQHDRMAVAHQRVLRLMQESAPPAEIDAAWNAAFELGLPPEKRAEAEEIFGTEAKRAAAKRARKGKALEQSQPTDDAGEEADIPEQVKALQARQAGNQS